MAIFGWTTRKDAARYTRLRAAEGAEAASGKEALTLDQKLNESVPLFPLRRRTVGQGRTPKSERLRRKGVAQGGIEPWTLRFSVACLYSTEATGRSTSVREPLRQMAGVKPPDLSRPDPGAGFWKDPVPPICPVVPARDRA